MSEPKILETYYVGKRSVYIIENDKTQTREELTFFWMGRSFNGKTVIGVESHAVPVIYEGAKIGLMVSELTP